MKELILDDCLSHCVLMAYYSRLNSSRDAYILLELIGTPKGLTGGGGV